MERDKNREELYKKATAKEQTSKLTFPKNTSIYSTSLTINNKCSKKNMKKVEAAKCSDVVLLNAIVRKNTHGGSHLS